MEARTPHVLSLQPLTSIICLAEVGASEGPSQAPVTQEAKWLSLEQLKASQKGRQACSKPYSRARDSNFSSCSESLTEYRKVRRQKDGNRAGRL